MDDKRQGNKGMKRGEAGNFRTQQGAEFGYLFWRSNEEKARVYAMHGMGSAATEFAPLGDDLSARGISVYAVNLRGNGYDPEIGSRGHRFQLDLLQQDFLDWLEATGAGEYAKPIFLCGESMGALLASYYLTQEPIAKRFQGGVLLSPVVELNKKVPAILEAAIRMIARLFPRLPVGPGKFVHGNKPAPPLTRNPQYEEYLKSAPHRILKYTIHFTAGVGDLMRQVQEKAGKLKTPILLLIGGDDGFIEAEKARSWFEKVAATDKRFLYFPEGKHVLIHDLVAQDAFQAIGDWIQERSESRA